MSLLITHLVLLVVRTCQCRGMAPDCHKGLPRRKPLSLSLFGTRQLFSCHHCSRAGPVWGACGHCPPLASSGRQMLGSGVVVVATILDLVDEDEAGTRSWLWWSRRWTLWSTWVNDDQWCQCHQGTFQL